MPRSRDGLKRIRCDKGCHDRWGRRSRPIRATGDVLARASSSRAISGCLAQAATKSEGSAQSCRTIRPRGSRLAEGARWPARARCGPVPAGELGELGGPTVNSTTFHQVPETRTSRISEDRPGSVEVSQRLLGSSRVDYVSTTRPSHERRPRSPVHLCHRTDTSLDLDEPQTQRLGDQGVVGSNPAVPTGSICCFLGCLRW
jgi:hypothetical protein